MTTNENILSIIDGATDHQRLVIVHRNPAPNLAIGLTLNARPFCEEIHIQAIRERPIVLRQETFSPAVGWFVQSEMELTMDQWSALRTTIVPATTARRSRAFRSQHEELVIVPMPADHAVPA